MTEGAAVGHNSALNTDERNGLKTIVERIERLEDEKKAISTDIAEIYTDAKERGYASKIIREIVKLRRLSADERREREALLETYMHALGMLADTELGQAAIARDLSPKPHADTGNPPFNAG